MTYSIVAHLNGAAINVLGRCLLLVIIVGDRFVNFRLLTPYFIMLLSPCGDSSMIKRRRCIVAPYLICVLYLYL